MMSVSRATVLWGLIAEHAAAGGRRVAVGDVCAVAVSSAQASGAWVAAASSRGPDFVLSVTDPVSEQLAELQLLLGEGPSHDVLAAAAPVLAADLGDQESARRWPAFTAEARNTGATGRVRVPADDRRDPQWDNRPVPQLSRPAVQLQLGDCLLLADTATVLLLESLDGGTPPADGDRARDTARRAVPRSGGAPGRDRPGHRHAHRAARRQRRGSLCPAPGLRLCPGQAAGRRGRRYRRPPPAPGS